MTMVKSLVALATERMLLKTSGPTFLRGIEFMYAAGLAPERLSVMMTQSQKYVLQFHSKCDVRPFAANYPNFARVLRGIVHVRAWRIKSIEFVNVAFDMRDVENLERAIDKLGVELVLLRNCSYPGVARGDEAVKFLAALNRKKQAVVCEYGDDRLKHRITRRVPLPRQRRPTRMLADLAHLNAEDREPPAAAEPPQPNAPAALPRVAQPLRPLMQALANVDHGDVQALQNVIQLVNAQVEYMQRMVAMHNGVRPAGLRRRLANPLAAALAGVAAGRLARARQQLLNDPLVDDLLQERRLNPPGVVIEPPLPIPREEGEAQDRDEEDDDTEEEMDYEEAPPAELADEPAAEAQNAQNEEPVEEEPLGLDADAVAVQGQSEEFEAVNLP
ncbi:unnamed protein product [Caenorhabditis auriculariae]|uniref:Uncharacterized protein n=1 Tax=Caenorhabditis auriculariae TaxID=2777116 RepID=A0A8S1HRH8_9PELO|nr:unnamed protein product [Caenorhabditis auriculariae]